MRGEYRRHSLLFTTGGFSNLIKNRRIRSSQKATDKLTSHLCNTESQMLSYIIHRKFGAKLHFANFGDILENSTKIQFAIDEYQKASKLNPKFSC